MDACIRILLTFVNWFLTNIQISAYVCMNIRIHSFIPFRGHQWKLPPLMMEVNDTVMASGMTSLLSDIRLLATSLSMDSIQVRTSSAYGYSHILPALLIG